MLQLIVHVTFRLLQLDTLRAGSVKDNMEVEHSKNEVKRLRDQLSDKNARIAELETLVSFVHDLRNILYSIIEA